MLCCLQLLLYCSYTAVLKDTGTKQYKVYTPVYKSSALVRANIVKSNEVQPIINPGKMYVTGNTIFLVEKEKGIHIIDNSNPSSPVNKAFISIPGNEDIAVKGEYFIRRLLCRPVAIDISNPSAIVLKNYVANLFPDRRYINGQYIDSGNVIVSWKVKDTTASLQIQQGQGIWTNGSYITTTVYNTAVGMFQSASANTSSSGTAGVGGSMSRFAIVNDRLYAVSSNQLSSVSVASPASTDFLSNKNLHMGMDLQKLFILFRINYL